jgi:starch synthase
MWSQPIINPSRCALLCSDQWATVSKSYRQEILETSNLKSLLWRFSNPFAFPNGVDSKVKARELAKLQDHCTEKAELLREFLKIKIDSSKACDEYILFGFVGRICAQKGVMLILEACENIIYKTANRAVFIIGGKIDGSEYSIACANRMKELTAKFPKNFWGSPNDFFYKGSNLNRGADFFLMPSMFEPGGIVQHEALIAGTPVVAFKTGGLKDSIQDFNYADGSGNGFTFQTFNSHDFGIGLFRAIDCYRNRNMYEQLRQNCQKSFMDISVVVQAWKGEFYRLFDMVPVDSGFLGPDVDIDEAFGRVLKGVVSRRKPQIKVMDPFSNNLRVSFKSEKDNWKNEHSLTFNHTEGYWECNDAPKGTYQFDN